jgi:hypothetical protein
MSQQNQFDIEPKAWSKFDPGLEEALKNLQADPNVDLPVIIALVSTEPLVTSEVWSSLEARRRQALERQRAFEHQVSDLIQALEQVKAQDIQSFWINNTVSARLTLPALRQICQREDVKQIVLVVPQKVTC